MKKWLCMLSMLLCQIVMADDNFKLGDVKSYEDLQTSYLSFVKTQPKEKQAELDKSFKMILMSSVLLGSEKLKSADEVHKETIIQFKRLTDNKTPEQINALYKHLSDTTMIDAVYELMQAQKESHKEKIKELENKVIGNSQKLPE